MTENEQLARDLAEFRRLMAMLDAKKKQKAIGYMPHMKEEKDRDKG